MKVYYGTAADVNGHHYIYDAVYDRDAFSKGHSVNIPVSVLEIDEVVGNKDLCRSIAESLHKRDVDDECRYYVDDGGNVVEKEGWTERGPEV